MATPSCSTSPGRPATASTDRHEAVSIELGSAANPPGFDANLIGLEAGAEKTFNVHFPEDYPVTEMANSDVSYSVTVKELRHKALPALDDELAKDLKFESLAALRDQVRTDLQEEATDNATRHVRSEILKQLADRLQFEPPASMVDREIDRRLEEFARQLMQQQVDPRQAGIDWAQFREAQRDAARAAVASALALDEIAKRDSIVVSADDVDKEIEKFALRAGRTPAALRAQLEKEGGVARLTSGLRREKALEHALAQASIASGPPRGRCSNGGLPQRWFTVGVLATSRRMPQDNEGVPTARPGVCKVAVCASCGTEAPSTSWACPACGTPLPGELSTTGMPVPQPVGRQLVAAAAPDVTTRPTGTIAAGRRQGTADRDRTHDHRTAPDRPPVRAALSHHPPARHRRHGRRLPGLGRGARRGGRAEGDPPVESRRIPKRRREVERRFKRELLLARQVTHKNVVRIHDLGEIDGIKYITMSYVEGDGPGDQAQDRGASCRWRA